MDVIRTSDNTVVATVGGFSGPFAIALTPNGRRAYVTNFGSNNFEPFGTTVSVVDLTTNQIVDMIDLGIQPSGIAIANNCLAYVTNYNTLYAAPDFQDLTAGQGTVNIIDTKSNTVIAPTIVVGQSPANIVIAPNGKYAYVSNYTSNTVSVIKLKH
jgi:YVTN family beta-propeller protein